MTGPRTATVNCPGSGEQATDITAPPVRSKDRVFTLRYGIGVCPVCWTERALDKDGKIRPHRERTT